MCFVNDGFGPSAYSSTRQRARKSHCCCECGGAISIGDVYQKVWGVWDGDPRTFKTCDACSSLRERIKAHELADGCDEREAICPFGELGDYLVNIATLTEWRLAREAPFKIAEMRDAFMALPVHKAGKDVPDADHP